jgi:membrane fusion protein, multidrug efflux system
MAKRMFLMLAATAAVLGGLGFVKYRQVQASAKASAFQPPPEAVTTIIAHQETWPSTLNVVGTIQAVHGVVVSADLPGTVQAIHFESGRMVREGEILAELDTRQERAQLAALEAQRDLAKVNFTRAQTLADQGVISRSDYDRSAAEQKQTEANVGEIKAAIQRKTIRAPFSGVLGIRQANLGQYLAAGSAIVSLQSLDPIYVNFGVPQETIGNLRMGQKVHLRTGNVPGAEFTGEVTALDSIVDAATRNIQVQATIRNPGAKLRPGMFAEVVVGVGSSRPLVSLPASAVSYAPFGDSVYIVTDMKGPDGKPYRGVRQQFVKVEGSRGDQVGIASGVQGGEEVVTSGVFKLRNGAAVLVNNKIQPSNNPAPRPEDN